MCPYLRCRLLNSYFRLKRRAGGVRGHIAALPFIRTVSRNGKTRPRHARATPACSLPLWPFAAAAAAAAQCAASLRRGGGAGRRSSSRSPTAAQGSQAMPAPPKAKSSLQPAPRPRQCPPPLGLSIAAARHSATTTCCAGTWLNNLDVGQPTLRKMERRFGFVYWPYIGKVSLARDIAASQKDLLVSAAAPRQSGGPKEGRPAQGRPTARSGTTRQLAGAGEGGRRARRPPRQPTQRGYGSSKFAKERTPGSARKCNFRAGRASRAQNTPLSKQLFMYVPPVAGK
eukprot:gene8802-biopygen15199